MNRRNDKKKREKRNVKINYMAKFKNYAKWQTFSVRTENKRLQCVGGRTVCDHSNWECLQLAYSSVTH